MTTSISPTVEAELPEADRVPLRLRLNEHPGRDRLDGGWWPQSRDLARELADLVDHFPAESGRVIRALYSPPDWEAAPRRVPVAHGCVEVEALPADDPHVIHLRTADRTTLHLLVVPPSYTDAQGDEALLASGSLLDTVTEHPDVDPADHWTAQDS